MLLALFTAYVSSIIFAVSSTIFLILCGSGWGQLPHLYLRAVRRIQKFYPELRPPQSADIFYPGIIAKARRSALVRSLEDSSARFHFFKDTTDFWTLTSDAARSGIEAIIQDELSPTFDYAPVNDDSLLPLFIRPNWNFIHKLIFFALTAFRIGFLLPVRVCLLSSSFVYCSICCLTALVYPFTDVQKTNIAITYCRLFCSGIGLVAKFKNQHLRPKRPGVAISNHLSPNDIQIIFTDVQPGASYGYTVTGQKHKGIIWVIEHLVEQLCPAMWLERSSESERKSFTGLVLEEARISGPVLLFPEGFCTNNTSTLQYRKAVFEDNLDIYPIAIRQNSAYGDHFWKEDRFYTYLLRVLTSWAIVYDVTYLPVMRREEDETASAFALRAQKAIADAAEIRAVPFDGTFWYKKEVRARYKRDQQAECAGTVLTFLDDNNESELGENTSDFDLLDTSPTTILQKPPHFFAPSPVPTTA